MSKRLLRALYRGLIFARERPEESIRIIENEWKVDHAVARESYASLGKSFSLDGMATEAGVKFHLQQIQTMDKRVGEIPLNKIADFRLLEELQREMHK